MTSGRPRVAIVGGVDVDARIELMRELDRDFELIAIGSSPDLRERFAEAGFEYADYRLTRTVSPLRDLRTIVQLVRIFRRLRPDIVHTFDTKPNLLARIAARISRTPVVVGTITGLGSLYARNDWRTRLIRFVYELVQSVVSRMSDMTVFQNGDDRLAFVSGRVVPEKKSHIILGSGVSTASFSRELASTPELAALRQQLELGSDELIVLMVTRVVRSKGVLEFAAASDQVRARLPNVRFVLVGPDDRDAIDPLTPGELAQLDRSVTWLGYRNDIANLLSLSDIFALPSAYREGIPRVLLEAAAMGLPIVTTDSPGCNEIVRDGVNGFLVPILDAAALADAIGCLLADVKLRQRFGEASRQRLLDSFDLPVVAAATRSLYRDLLERRVARATNVDVVTGSSRS